MKIKVSIFILIALLCSCIDKKQNITEFEYSYKNNSGHKIFLTKFSLGNVYDNDTLLMNNSFTHNFFFEGSQKIDFFIDYTYPFDSVYIDFDHIKYRVDKKNFPNKERSLYNVDTYEFKGGNIYQYVFTEQDYVDADSI